MKKTFFSIIILLFSTSFLIAQVGINNDAAQPHPSAMLDVKASNKGFLLPRMTYEQRNSIANPAEGLMVFCTDCGINGALCFYSNGDWRTFSPCINNSPAVGTNVASTSQIEWNWIAATGATGYKWNTANNYSTGIDVGNTTTKTEKGLNCITVYTRYVWAYNECGTSFPTMLNESTLPKPSSPLAANHVPSSNQIVWNWNTATGASGYKWNTIDDYASAIDLRMLTTKVETGLACNTPYTRFIWAYNVCGVSESTTIDDTTSMDPVATEAGTHVPSLNQIVWKWIALPGATGYKWGVTNDYSSAIDMGTSLLIVETGLVCNTNYTRFIWADNECGHSVETVLDQETLSTPIDAPVAATHGSTLTEIAWNWNSVPGATGYKWAVSDSFATATDLGMATTKTESGLSCNSTYTRYVWAYRACGYSLSTSMTKTTGACVLFPIVTTATITNIAQTTAVGGGNVTFDGGAAITARGVCWGTSPNPTIADNKTIDGTGTGIFTSSLTGLTPTTTYYVRAYATNSMGTAYGNQGSFSTSAFAIGQTFGGGVIFYIDGTGSHGLISATTNQSTGTMWGCKGTPIGSTATSIGTGQANTTAIVNGCPTAGIAARICNNLLLNGYDDWFLPSKDELYAMYLQKNVIGGFINYYYWSSSEFDANNAWFLHFDGGIQVNYVKDGSYYVRAIRAF